MEGPGVPARLGYLSDVPKKSELQRQLEKSIKLAKKNALPSQLRRDALGRKLQEQDRKGPTALDDPDKIGVRRIP